jgi:hypothetical protein
VTGPQSAPVTGPQLRQAWLSQKRAEP